MSVGKILCCECGVAIEPNAANMCVGCLRSKVDITDDIPKQVALFFCRNCERYLQPPNTWIPASLESRELLSICLKRLRGLSKVRLVDAGFVWTEPHSKRVKVKLSIQKEVLSGAILQQVFVVEYVVHNQMCEECQRVEAKNFWRAVVQLRQKAVHKKTLLYVEQLILKYQAHAKTTSIKAYDYGMDFYFAQKQDARKMVDFFVSVIPCKYQVAQELISHDDKNNTYNYKWTFGVEVVPVCKNDVVCLPVKLAQQLGNFSQVAICQRVNQLIQLIDPSSLALAEVSESSYWRNQFRALCSPSQLIEFIVMEIETAAGEPGNSGMAQRSRKHVLADVWVMRASTLGSSSASQYHTRSHLGHLLSVGDSVLGFLLSNSNVNDDNLDAMKPDKIPDVVLVKKYYAPTVQRSKKRKWKLQHIDPDFVQMETRDYADFLEDLEEDPDYRKGVNIFKDKNKLEVSDIEDEDVPQIALADMLEDLHIDDPMGDHQDEN